MAGLLKDKDKEGELVCRIEVKTGGFVFKSWKRRHVLLSGFKLTFHNSSTDLTVCATYNIVPKQTKVSLPSERQGTFQSVTFPSDEEQYPTNYPLEVTTDKNTLIVCADDAKKRRYWM